MLNHVGEYAHMVFVVLELINLIYNEITHKKNRFKINDRVC